MIGLSEQISQGLDMLIVPVISWSLAHLLRPLSYPGLLDVETAPNSIIKHVTITLKLYIYLYTQSTQLLSQGKTTKNRIWMAAEILNIFLFLVCPQTSMLMSLMQAVLFSGSQHSRTFSAKDVRRRQVCWHSQRGLL